MPVILTHELAPGYHPESDQIYNGLDTAVTFEVFEALQRLHNTEPPIYAFERALQAPAIEMMLRGFKVDAYERQRGIKLLTERVEKLSAILNRYAFSIWGKGLNPRSPKQLIEFFYGVMKLPEVWTSKKGQRKLSTDREALEKLQLHFYAMPIIAVILAIRDAAKQLEVLTTEIDPDGRMRTSYNIAGTETGRWSSSANAFGTGTNLQNLSRDDDSDPTSLNLRRVFVADPGYKLCGIDLEQAESREVGWLCGILFNDWSYYDACLSGDLHTTVAIMAFPDIKWTSDPKANRGLAEQPYYRNNTFRDMCKKLGHGSNYYGKPFTMARHAKIPTRMAESFQSRYFGVFPGIPRWHRHTAQCLQTSQRITTPFGRERIFFGRPDDDSTLREAIAFSPQSSTADRLNLVLYRIWQKMGDRVQILAQVHDALYFQFPEKLDEQEIVAEALSHFTIDIRHGDRQLLVPGEAKVGWNWSNYSKANPDGLKKVKAGVPDDRTRTTILDRRL